MSSTALTSCLQVDRGNCDGVAFVSLAAEQEYDRVLWHQLGCGRLTETELEHADCILQAAFDAGRFPNRTGRDRVRWTPRQMRVPGGFAWVG